MAQALSVVEIVLSAVLVTLVILQAKGSELGGFLGGASDSSGGGSTRRGVEATMHRLTIYTSITFFLVTIAAVLVLGNG